MTPASSSVFLRPWGNDDIDALVRYANNRKIWLNLRDRFPYPYTRAEAGGWIAFCESQGTPVLNFAIDLSGEAVGGIGFERMTDVHRMTVEVGYWIGEPFWGRGIASDALAKAVDYAFGTLSIERIQATAFAGNVASTRVLEKNGFEFEGRLKNYVLKDDRLLDALMYARTRG